MPVSSLERYAIDQTYLSTARLIYQTTQKFHHAHGGNFEELLSEAGVHFMKAYRSYNPDKGAFSTWLTTKIWYGLLELVHCPAAVRQRMTRTSGLMFDEVKDPYEQRTTDLLDSLSPDGRMVARLVLSESFRDLRLMGAPFQIISKPAQVRGMLGQALRNMGWSQHRVERTFNEIAGAL